MSGANITDAQARDEAMKAKALLETEYFLTVTSEMQLAAMEQAIVAPTEELRREARIEVLMLRKMLGYLQVLATIPQDAEAARRNARAME